MSSIPGPVQARHGDEERIERFLEAIERSGELPRGISARQVATTMLCTLIGRVPGGEARIFVASLPARMREALGPGAAGRDERGERFGREEFLKRGADQLDVPTDRVEALARVVFDATEHVLGSSEVDDIESQLPADLKALWRPWRHRA